MSAGIWAHARSVMRVGRGSRKGLALRRGPRACARPADNRVATNSPSTSIWSRIETALAQVVAQCPTAASHPKRQRRFIDESASGNLRAIKELRLVADRSQLSAYEDAVEAVWDDFYNTEENPAPLGRTQYKRYTLPGGKDYRELLLKWDIPRKLTGAIYNAPHFDNALNVLAHVRLKERRGKVRTLVKERRRCNLRFAVENTRAR
jgi:hypothetical protein